MSVMVVMTALMLIVMANITAIIVIATAVIM